MAAASHLKITSSGRKTSFSAAQPSAWQPQPQAMHVARPKSAKGRTRSSLNCPHGPADHSCQAPAALQPLPRCEDLLAGRRASSSQQLHPPAQACPAEIPDLLQQVPVRTSSSLNKYRVLPSIARKGLKESAQPQARGPPGEQERAAKDLPPRVGKGAAHGGGGGIGRGHAQAPRLPASQAKPALNPEEPPEGEPRLLLAVRSPSGHRFECHFRPTDSLRAVVAAAERETSVAYGRCRVKTAEVPRRTFADLGKTLQECGIAHKSVLCVLQEDDG